jgi:enoyl-CoA hydratase/carnithine racemase
MAHCERDRRVVPQPDRRGDQGSPCVRRWIRSCLVNAICASPDNPLASAFRSIRLGFAIAYDRNWAGLLGSRRTRRRRRIAARRAAYGVLEEAFGQRPASHCGLADDQVGAESYAAGRRIADGCAHVCPLGTSIFIRRPYSPYARSSTSGGARCEFDYLKTEDYATGIDAFLNKRQTPTFKGHLEISC